MAQKRRRKLPETITIQEFRYPTVPRKRSLNIMCAVDLVVDPHALRTKEKGNVVMIAKLKLVYLLRSSLC